MCVPLPAAAQSLKWCLFPLVLSRQSAKVRSLANHCFDLKVKRPTKAQIAARYGRRVASAGYCSPSA